MSGRDLITSRNYRKGTDRHELFVARISGAEVSGEVLQFELWLNNMENREARVTSGNKYAVRRAFIEKLLDLHEDGWSRQGSATFGSSALAFFDPAGL